MATTYNHVRVSIVDDDGNVRVIYPETTAADVSISRANNANIPTTATTVQLLANALGSHAFDSASYSASNHTHGLSLATDSGTSSISLAANTKYKLTAGGSTYIFTTPSDTNTWRGIQNNLTSDSTTESLSAAQGKALKSLVDGKAASGHTHGLSLATDSGTSSISLAANTKYKLTAGGSTYIFTTPPDNNTTYSVVSTSGNGLAPKVTDTSKFLKGDGTWATPTDTNNRRGFYGTSDTAAATAEKAVTLGSTAGWELVAGTIVGVKFTNTNTAGTVKLNVNSSGAKQIWYSGGAYTGTEARITGWAGHVIYYMYDGTYWCFLNNDNNYVDTNTTYSSKSAASGGTDVSLVTTGEKYTWNNKSTLAIGTTATTAAAGNHTHGLSLATDSGTASISLAANTTYKLTAGGSTYIFKTPVDNNTTYSSQAAASGGTTLSLVTTGEKYTWNNKSTLAIGTTGSTAAAGNHTHTTSLAADSGTSSITLAHGSKYKLTAGGNSVIFTMPSDNNTTYSAGTGLSLSSTTFSLAASGVSAGSYGPSANVDGTNGTTMSVPYITVDTYGRVTSISNKTYTSRNTDTDTKNTAGSTDTSSKILLIGATSQAANPQTYSDDQVFVTNGTLQANNAQAVILGVNSTTGTTGGISLYNGTSSVDEYGISFRQTSNKEKHGYVQSDWATYFTTNSSGNTRGWIFRRNVSGGNVASVSGDGNAVFNGSVTVGGNQTNTSGARMQYNSTNKCIDFVFA